MAKRLVVLFMLATILALPFVFRPKERPSGRSQDTLVVITPHNEAIRREFAAGFQRWYRDRTGRTVALDWRVVGGTSDIGRYLDSEYTAAFRLEWTRRLRREWNADVQMGFANPRLSASASAVAREARETFLASATSCGIDVFFGGGSYDLIQQADAGRVVPTQVLRRHPEWFRDEVIPREFAGEQYWDRDGRWVGNVLSNYGILFNRDALQRLGIERPPATWSDLANPRYMGQLALADPTKSSSIAKAFDNLIQQQIQRRLAQLRRDETKGALREMENRAVREGWLEGMRLLQALGANARYFTDSSQKPPIDVAQGDCAAGICIDFYGRAQAEATTLREAGRPRLGFVTPRGGTVSSVDPIALLRGAPHRDVAELFIEYTLAMDGQKLWNFRPGTPGGPQHFALRRLPVRRDFYQTTEWKSWRSDPEADPFSDDEQLISRPEWTAPVFREMAFVVRVMALDTHHELTRAWRAVQAASEPGKRRALAKLQDFSAVTYEQASTEIHRALSSENRIDELECARRLGDYFRANYAAAEAEALRK